MSATTIENTVESVPAIDGPVLSQDKPIILSRDEKLRRMMSNYVHNGDKRILALPLSTFGKFKFASAVNGPKGWEENLGDADFTTPLTEAIKVCAEVIAETCQGSIKNVASMGKNSVSLSAGKDVFMPQEVAFDVAGRLLKETGVFDSEEIVAETGNPVG